MMLVEVRWGVRMGWANLTVAPLSATAFTVALPNLAIAYDAGSATTVLTASWGSLAGTRQVVVGGLQAGGYTAQVAGAPFTPLHVTVGGDGTLVVPGVPVGAGIMLTVARG
jgi:hypothetical protein